LWWEKFVLCRICEQSISHSSTETKHSEQYVEFEKALEIGEQDKGKGKAVPQQLSLPEDCE